MLLLLDHLPNVAAGTWLFNSTNRILIIFFVCKNEPVPSWVCRNFKMLITPAPQSLANALWFLPKVTGNPLTWKFWLLFLLTKCLLFLFFLKKKRLISAKALAVAGLSEIGRDRYGVFPLRGKLVCRFIYFYIIYEKGNRNRFVITRREMFFVRV